MNVKQYSDIQRQLGVLEGIGATFDNDLAMLYFDAIEVISSTIDEIYEEGNH